MNNRRRNIQVHPVRWIFIKSPIPNQPYSQIRKIYEVELQNLTPKKNQEIDKQKLLELRIKTKKVLKQKQRKESLLNILTIIVLLIMSTILVYFLIKD